MEATAIQRADRSSNGVLDNLDFEAWLFNWTEFVKGEMNYGISYVQAAVTMHIRARGVTVSDMVSNWGTRAGTQNQWMAYDQNLDGTVHPLNIVGPALTTNKNACLQSNSQTEVTSANQSAEHKQIAQKWQRICDYLERQTWNEAKRGFVFDDVQKGGTNIIDTFPKEIDTQNVPKVGDAKIGLAIYQCSSCGVRGLAQAPMPENEDAETVPDNEQSEAMQTQIPCPQCQQPAPAMVSPIEGLQMGEDSVPVYDIKGEIIPSFNFTMDDYGAKIGGIKTATWCQVQRLQDLMWMQTHFPGRSFTGPSRWSYPVQCDYALARGRWQYLNQQPRQQSWAMGHERYEVKEIYLHEDSYKSQRFRQDFEFVDCFGETTFRIKAGQTIGEAQEEMYGEDQHGFKFIWCEETLLTIVSPEKEELNMRDRFSDVHWSRESGSYRSAPNYSIVYIQDELTLSNTQDSNIVARNAHNPIFYDSQAFDKADFSNEWIGTKKAALLPGESMGNRVFSLPVPTPSPHLARRLEFLWGIKDSVSMVQPAMRGELQRGQTYGAQHEAIEQSYGNLTSVLKSFAQCKCDTFINQAKLCKKFWTKEQFQTIGSMFDEIWSEEDVAEMCEIDLERDLVVGYRQGSEMPSTPASKEQKFFAFLQNLGALPPEMVVQIVTQDQWAKIIETAGDYGGVDFDVSGLEIDEIVSQKRFIKLAKLCMPYQDWSFDQVQAAKQQVVGQTPPDAQAVQQSIQLAQSNPNDPQVQQQAQAMATPTPISAMDVITERIFHESEIRFSQYEDLDQQNTFFIQMLRNEQGKGKPNEVLIEMLEVLLGMLGQAIEQGKEAAAANDPQLQAAAQADKEAQDQLKAENDLAAQKIQVDAQKAQSDAEYKQGTLELKAKEIEVKAHAGDRDALLDAAKHDSEIANAPGEAAEAPEHLLNSVATKFTDIPEEGQQQMLKDAGINVSKAALVKTKKDAVKAAAKPVVPAKPAPKKK